MQNSVSIKTGRRLDVRMAIGAIAAVIVAYALGYVLIDVTGLISVNGWQAESGNVGGVRFFAGASAMGLIGIAISLWANR